MRPFRQIALGMRAVRSCGGIEEKNESVPENWTLEGIFDEADADIVGRSVLIFSSERPVN